MNDEVVNPLLTDKLPAVNPSVPNVIGTTTPYGDSPRGVRIDTKSIDSPDDPSQGISPRISPRVHHWATNNMLQHDVILQDIERNDYTNTQLNRSRNSSVAQELNLLGTSNPTNLIPRKRHYSMDSLDGIQAYQSTAHSRYRFLFNLLDSTIPKFQNRINIYVSLFFLFCLYALGQNLNYANSWFGLFFALIGLDIATAIIDHAFFVYFIDKVFYNHFDIAYLLHGFNGPIGMLIAVFVAKDAFNSFDAIKFFPSWGHCINAAILVLLFVCVKNWYSRKHYIALLERRFTDKLFQMETWTILLSELALQKPPKSRRTHHRSHRGSRKNRKGATNPSTDELEEEREKVGEYIESLENDLSVNGIGTLFSAVPGFNSIQSKVINVFADLVEATSKYNDDYEEDVDLTAQIRRNRGYTVLSATTTNSQKLLPREQKNSSDKKTNPNDTAAIHQLRTQVRKRKTFWELAARTSMNLGALKVMTYNGPVVIRRKFQAKEFGKSLYLHLSRGNKYYITHAVLESLFKNSDRRNISEKGGKNPPQFVNNNPFTQTNDVVEDDLEYGGSDRGRDEEADMARRGNYTAVRMLSERAEKDTGTLLYETAVTLLDPFDLGYVTEEQCMAAVCLVYKEHRYAATSLNEYGELHQSLRGVIDFVFWTAIIVILQTYLSFNFYTQYILPFVTMAFTISFALGPALSNILLACVFVFFMVPYEIGNKIYIGADPNTRICGFVRGVSLLHTTITTLNNEVMKVPNHSLFSEKICNLNESGGVCFEVVVVFNLDASNPSLQTKIDDYFSRVKTYAIADNKADWESCGIFCTSIDTVKNSTSYSVYLTHRDNYQNMGKALLAKQEILKFMRQLMIQMGLGYRQIRQPIVISSDAVSEIKLPQNDSSAGLLATGLRRTSNAPPLAPTMVPPATITANSSYQNIFDISSPQVERSKDD